MTDELVPYVSEEKPMTAVEVKAQVHLIQEVMKAVMQDGQHYGKIPGAGDKPTLLKPGAEKIMATFRLSVDPEVEDLSKEDQIRYRIKCKLVWPSGRYAGAGVGEASTDEEKYKWRAIISEAEWNNTPENLKRVKYRRDGEVKQIRTNPADIANTVLKMAKKRALVDAVLTVTAASDIFTQDLEDMPEELIQKKPPLKEPEKKNGQPATEKTITVIEDVATQTGKIKDGEKKGQEWQMWIILGGDKVHYRTFSKTLGELAIKERGTMLPILIEHKQSKYGREIMNLEPAERTPGEEG